MNKFIVENDFGIIIAKNGERIIVDKELVEELSMYYTWFICKDGEPMANKKINRVAYRIKLKRIVADTFKKDDRDIYYRNKNPLDNRLNNLTFCNNEIFVDGDIAYIHSTDRTKKKYVIKFDSNMVDKVSQYSWTLKDKGYMFRRENKKTKFLHNLLANISDDSELYVDHIDRDPTNNLMSNLRVCTHGENQFNKSKIIKHNTTSSYKGVSYYKGRWRSRVMINRKEIHLGDYVSEIAAANSYNYGAIKYHGEFASINELTVDNIIAKEDLREYEQGVNYKKSKYRGVSKTGNKWFSRIRVKGEYKHLGTYETEEEAAISFNKAVEEYGLSTEKNAIN